VRQIETGIIVLGEHRFSVLSVRELHVLWGRPQVTSEYSAQMSPCGGLSIPLLFNNNSIGGLGFFGSQDCPIAVLDLEIEAPNVYHVVERGLPCSTTTPAVSHVVDRPIGPPIGPWL
jgi:hypothetical protein